MSRLGTSCSGQHPDLCSRRANDTDRSPLNDCQRHHVYEGAAKPSTSIWSNASDGNATIADNLRYLGTIRDDGTGSGGSDNDTPALSVCHHVTVAEGAPFWGVHRQSVQPQCHRHHRLAGSWRNGTDDRHRHRLWYRYGQRHATLQFLHGDELVSPGLNATTCNHCRWHHFSVQVRTGRSSQDTTSMRSNEAFSLTATTTSPAPHRTPVRPARPPSPMTMPHRQF